MARTAAAEIVAPDPVADVPRQSSGEFVRLVGLTTDRVRPVQFLAADEPENVLAGVGDTYGRDEIGRAVVA